MRVEDTGLKSQVNLFNESTLNYANIDLNELVSSRDAAARAVIQNPKLRIWQFNSLFEHDVAVEKLANELSHIEIIDQYSGSLPELFSLRRHKAGKIALNVDRTLLLDSNVSRYLRKYVNETLPEPVRGEVAKLLSWYASKAMSVNPGFSLMEAISGGNDPDFDGVELIKLALVLSGMDRRAFLQSGEIKLGADGFRNLRLHFGTLDLDDAARIEYSRLPKGTSKIVDPTYAALLKIALIDASLPSAPFSKKLDDFMTFLENTLGAIIAVELVTAILFFAGQIRKFIPLRTSAPVQQRLADVRSSAWDIYLARMAPAFIGQGDESNLILPMIVTGDQRLKKILRAQTLAGVVAVEGRPPYPVVGTDFAYLEKFAPRGWDSTSLQKRLANRNRPVQQPIQGNFSPLIASLEEEAELRFVEGDTSN